MHKGVILNLKRFKVFDFISINHSILIISFLFIIGLIVGILIYPENAAVAEFSKNLIGNYIKHHNNNSLFEKILFCLLRYLILLAFLFLSGTSMLGVALVPFAITAQGIAFGNLFSHLYFVHSLKGIAFNAIILLPPSLIFAVCSFFAARESINFSLLIAKLTMPKTRPANIYNDFKFYCGKYLIFLVVLLVAASTDGILSMFFLHFFDF